MSGKAEELKGRVKEAAGAITDNDQLRRRGSWTKSSARSPRRWIGRRKARDQGCREVE